MGRLEKQRKKRIYTRSQNVEINLKFKIKEVLFNLKLLQQLPLLFAIGESTIIGMVVKGEKL